MYCVCNAEMYDASIVRVYHFFSPKNNENCECGPHIILLIGIVFGSRAQILQRLSLLVFNNKLKEKS